MQGIALIVFIWLGAMMVNGICESEKKQKAIEKERSRQARKAQKKITAEKAAKKTQVNTFTEIKEEDKVKISQAKKDLIDAQKKAEEAEEKLRQQEEEAKAAVKQQKVQDLVNWTTNIIQKNLSTLQTEKNNLITWDSYGVNQDRSKWDIDYDEIDYPSDTQTGLTYFYNKIILNLGNKEFSKAEFDYLIENFEALTDKPYATFIAENIERKLN